LKVDWGCLAWIMRAMKTWRSCRICSSQT